jgi:hypothetical protein
MGESTSHQTVLLLVVDCFTRWGWAFSLERKTREYIFKVLLPLLVNEGFDCIQGNDPLLLDEEFQEYIGDNNIDLDFSTPTIAETVLAALLQVMKQTEVDTANWDEFVLQAVHNVNVAENKAIQV